MSTSLKLAFSGNGVKKINFSFAPAEVNATGAQVKSLMEEIVANGDIYMEPPLGLLDAKFDIHTVIPVDIA